MATLTQNPRTAEHLLWEAGDISRDVVTIASGQNLKAGTPVGKVTASGKFIAYKQSATDGSETCLGVTYDAVDATAGDQKAILHARLAEIDGALLNWGTGVTLAGKDTAIGSLSALNIIVR